MARFHQLTVTGLRNTTRDAVVVTLDAKDGSAFRYRAGQYLTFRRAFGDQEIRRSYSICTGEHESTLQVGIKRVEDGAFSTWANDELQVGDQIEAMPPMGKFFIDFDESNNKHYLAFAGGSGITPVLSVIKSALIAEPHSSFSLVYANKGVNTIMFREDIEDLKNRFMGRFKVVHILETDAQEIDLFTGLVTEQKCAELFASGWINPANVDVAFICGPEPMMLGIAAALRTIGLADDKIKYELFASDQPGRVALKSKTANQNAETDMANLSVTLDGATQNLRVSKDTSILEAALQNSLDAPFACKAGVCSTCMCRLVSGEVDMIANHALEDYEVAKGYILSCQSYPLTDDVSVEYE